MLLWQLPLGYLLSADLRGNNGNRQSSRKHINYRCVEVTQMKPIIPTAYLSLVSLLTLSAGITSAQALPNFGKLQGLPTSTSESLISQVNPPAQPPMQPPGQPSVQPPPDGPPPPAPVPPPPPPSNSPPSADSKPGSSKNEVGCVVRFRHSPCALRLRESPQAPQS
jgi:hypothetical protein